MKKPQEKAMSKVTATCLMGYALVMTVGITTGFMFLNDDSIQKHLGSVTVRRVDNRYGSLEFIRPNGEFFETKFTPGWNNPNIQTGDVLKDVVYTDSKNGESLFVKAVLDHESPVADKILYESASTGWVTVMCTNESNSCGYVSQIQKSYYLWSDGGYRDKPETKKAAHETN